VTIISERAKESARDPNEGRSTLSTGAGDTYHRRQEVEALERVQKVTDTFAVVRWHTKRDDRLEQDILAGPVDSWLLDQSSSWTHRAGATLGELTQTPLSEPPLGDGERPVIVGLQFTLGTVSHILRIDPTDLAAKKAKGKKETGRAK
jgi:hypothetical protein